MKTYGCSNNNSEYPEWDGKMTSTENIFDFESSKSDPMFLIGLLTLVVAVVGLFRN